MMDKLLLSNSRSFPFIQRRGYLPVFVSQVLRELQHSPVRSIVRAGSDRCIQTLRPRSQTFRKPVLLPNTGCANCAKRQLSTLRGNLLVRDLSCQCVMTQPHTHRNESLQNGFDKDKVKDTSPPPTATPESIPIN